MQKPKHLERGDTVAIVSLSAGTLGEPWAIHKYHLAKERLERDYGLKVKPEPGYGDALSMAYDGEEIEVLAIVTWEDADDDELLYWGNIEWDGHDAYVCMAYLEKVN